MHALDLTVQDTPNTAKVCIHIAIPKDDTRIRVLFTNEVHGNKLEITIPTQLSDQSSVLPEDTMSVLSVHQASPHQPQQDVNIHSDHYGEEESRTPAPECSVGKTKSHSATHSGLSTTHTSMAAGRKRYRDDIRNDGEAGAGSRLRRSMRRIETRNEDETDQESESCEGHRL